MIDRGVPREPHNFGAVPCRIKRYDKLKGRGQERPLAFSANLKVLKNS